MKNDYAIISFAINTDILYPFIPYAEWYMSNRVYTGSFETEHIPIEGAAINPRLVSLGFRYFIAESSFLGLYSIVNVNRDEDFIREIYGVDFSLQF